MTKTCLAAAVALVLGAAPLSPALAFGPDPYAGPYAHDEIEVLGAFDLDGIPAFGGCGFESAAEGNADQQTRPVRQYGQTAGGPRC